MSTTHQLPKKSFVLTLTVNKKPYLLYAEVQTDETCIVTCRNCRDISPIHFYFRQNQWQTADGLPEELEPLAGELSNILSEEMASSPSASV